MVKHVLAVIVQVAIISMTVCSNSGFHPTCIYSTVVGYI